MMVSFITASKAQKMIGEHIRTRRLTESLTQKGLAMRSGVSLPTLRKFEQKGIISLESFLKLLAVLDALTQVVEATAPNAIEFSSIDDVLKASKKSLRQKGSIT
jgi:transcriptional regulator with XRE-family HTH domain